MLPRYRISLYSEGPKEFRAAGAVFRVASLYVGLAAGFASSSSSSLSVASTVGSWIRAFFVCLFLSFFVAVFRCVGGGNINGIVGRG